jgi:hypothetical protein
VGSVYDHYTALAQSADPVERAVAGRQLMELARRSRLSAGEDTVSAWQHVPLAPLFEQAGNPPTRRSNGTVQCGHEPVHGSRSGSCVIVWPEDGRWWCSSCHRGGDAVAAVQSLEGCPRPAAIARLGERYGFPPGFGLGQGGGLHA